MKESEKRIAYAVVEEESLKIARHHSKGTMAIFSSLTVLKNNAWRYKRHDKQYKVAELVISKFLDIEV